MQAVGGTEASCGCFWFLAPALVAALIVAAFRRARRSGSRNETPEEIIEQRYGRGEIDREEVTSRRETIERSSRDPR